MRSLVFALAVMMSAGPVVAQQDDIQAVISSQFDAFRAGDVAEAFGFASPTIKRIFRTPENFGAMVRGGYPMIWAPGQVDFLGLRAVQGTRYQRVRVTDKAGGVFFFDYEMVETPDGWQINGVFPVKAPGLSA